MTEGKHLSDILKDLGYDARTRVTRNVENKQAVGRAPDETARATADKKGSGVTSFDPARSRALAEPPEEGSPDV